MRFEGDARGQIHTRKERLQRFVSLQIQVRATDGGTVVQLDFSPTVEGANYAACDSIVASVAGSIDAILGGSSQPVLKRWVVYLSAIFCA